MIRSMFIFLLSLNAFAQTATQTSTPVNCGNDYNCFYQQLNLQTQQQELMRVEEARVNQQNALMLEEARVIEMQKQTAIMEEQAERATFQDEKIEAQEEEIQSQKAEIETLRNTIEEMNQKKTTTPPAE